MGGKQGVRQTLNKLGQLCRQYASNPEVRLAAEQIIKGGLENHDQGNQVSKVLRYVKDKVVYLRDPQAWEYVKTPDLMLSQIKADGQTMGDCDDHVLLLNTLLDSLGFQTKFVAVIINGGNMFNHVISSVYMRGKWVDLDPCAKRVPQPFFSVRMESQTA